MAKHGMAKPDAPETGQKMIMVIDPDLPLPPASARNSRPNIQSARSRSRSRRIIRAFRRFPAASTTSAYLGPRPRQSVGNDQASTRSETTPEPPPRPLQHLHRRPSQVFNQRRVVFNVASSYPPPAVHPGTTLILNRVPPRTISATTRVFPDALRTQLRLHRVVSDAQPRHRA